MGGISTGMAAALVLAGVVAIPAFNPEVPPPGHTGGFGEPTCVICHQGSDLKAFGAVSYTPLTLPRTPYV